MSVSPPQPHLPVEEYDRLAWEYYKTLPLEHFMESVAHAFQREIVVESLAVLQTRRSDVSYFNELLVQYRHNNQLRRVVPDNMIVLNRGPAPTTSCFALEHETEAPFMMLEYVSESNEGKDYEDSFQKYEQELQTPYCLLFHPTRQDLQLFHHDGQHYVPVEPNARGRREIAELDLELAVVDGFVRFWHQGELLELPRELVKRIADQAEQLAGQNEQIAALTEQITALTEQITAKDEQISALTEQISGFSHQENAIQSLENQMAGVLAIFRSLVEPKARQAGREDILENLPTASLPQLQAWLTQLGP